MSVYDRLSALQITLPPVAVPAAAYVPFVRSGNLVFLSGHIAKQDGKPWVASWARTSTPPPARPLPAPLPSTCWAPYTPPWVT